MINENTQIRIEEILEKYKGFTPLDIAENLGIKIQYVNVKDPDFSGAIQKKGGDVILYVNTNDNEKRQIFTVAHELGHFFLHQKDLEQGIVSLRYAALYTRYNYEQRKKEEEANHFAAEILMPRKIFIHYFNKNSDLALVRRIEKMANFFGVSEDAVRIRMSYLDLIE